MATTGRLRVAPGEEIDFDWGNIVWDQSVQCFDTAADRDNQYPNPHRGAVCYLTGVGLWLHDGTRWQPIAGPVAHGVLAIPMTDVTFAQVTLTFPAGRFTVAPHLVTTPMVSNLLFTGIGGTGPTPTGAEVWARVYNDSKITRTVQVHWAAFG